MFVFFDSVMSCQTVEERNESVQLLSNVSKTKMKRNWCLLVLVFLFFLPLAFGQIGRSQANYPSEKLLKQAEVIIFLVAFGTSFYFL